MDKINSALVISYIQYDPLRHSLSMWSIDFAAIAVVSEWYFNRKELANRK